ncbi:MAG: large repetitive protein [Solirubrobacteraceae bacterium]|nr:large repetitive protein [Solirubrobacteraceae bacterium]
MGQDGSRTEGSRMPRTDRAGGRRSMMAAAVPRVVLRTGVAALLVAAVGPGTASAAVSGGRVIAVLTDTSGLELTNYAPNSSVAVSLLRNGVTIANGTTKSLADGSASLNGGGNPGDCWTDVTPDILAGDVVQVGNDSMIVQGLTSQRPVATLTPGTLEMHGTAADPAGQQLTGGRLEARIIATFTNNKKSLRAPAVYDGAGTGWTATFSGLSDADMQIALAAKDARGVFQNASLTETTISQNPGARGATPPCATPSGRYAVTQAGRDAVNLANVGADLVLSGTSANASAIDASLADAGGRKATVAAAITTNAATGAQTWTATIPAASVAGLADGTLTASASYTVPSGAVSGATLSLPKDTVAPPAPTATPGAGTYAGPQSVTLADDDPAATVRWTNGGSPPTASSPAFGAAISVTASQTIMSVAVDRAGNMSPSAASAYVINAPAAGTGTTTGTGTGPGTGTSAPRALFAGTIPGLFQPGVADVANAGTIAVAGRRVTVFAVGRLTMARRLTRRALTRQGLRATMQLPSGTRALRITVVRMTGARPQPTPVAVRTRVPSRAGLYRLQLRDRALLARLRPGRYVLRVQAGRSARALGTGTDVGFAITG